jgi:hypothetical protein
MSVAKANIGQIDPAARRASSGSIAADPSWTHLGDV